MARRRRLVAAALSLSLTRAIRGAAPPHAAAALRRRDERPLVSDFEVRCAAAGAVSTCVSHTLTLPLDVLKTKIQSDAALAGLTLYAVARRVVRTQGPLALLAGFTPNAAGYFMQGAIKFGLYEVHKRVLFEWLDRRGVADPRRSKRLPVWVAAAASAEVVACLALCPMEAAKIRLITEPSYAPSAFGALARVVRDTGAWSLWQGVGPIMVRQVPYTVAKLAGYEAIAQRVADPLASGVLAGGAAAVVSQPGDVILMRLCGGSARARLTGACSLEDVSMRAVVRAVKHPAELFVGLQPRAAMCALICASQFFIYEALRPHPPPRQESR